VAKAVRVRVSPSAPQYKNIRKSQRKSALSWLFIGKNWPAGHCHTRPAAQHIGSIVNLENYFPVLLFILIGIGVGVVPQILGRFLAPHNPDLQKNSPYECGFEAFEDARMKFDVRYYLVAILFILFDLETAFFFPWGVAMRDLGWPGFVTMLVFIIEFVVGFWYIWKKGALDWE
jgi:NADH-quinone oxidoreductase subunit A